MLEQLVIGLHLVTAHFPDRDTYRSETPGIYARIDDGWTAGVVRNSFDRWAVYGGKQFEPVKHVSLAVGVITGYERRDRPCTARESYEYGWHKGCWTGITKHVVSPMLVPSLYTDVKGATVRLNYIPRWSRPEASEALNLAVEYKFR
jgi:hypothetical protein